MTEKITLRNAVVTDDFFRKKDFDTLRSQVKKQN